jgi:hypothetical protein
MEIKATQCMGVCSMGDKYICTIKFDKGQELSFLGRTIDRSNIYVENFYYFERMLKEGKISVKNYGYNWMYFDNPNDTDNFLQILMGEHENQVFYDRNATDYRNGRFTFKNLDIELKQQNETIEFYKHVQETKESLIQNYDTYRFIENFVKVTPNEVFINPGLLRYMDYFINLSEEEIFSYPTFSPYFPSYYCYGNIKNYCDQYLNKLIELIKKHSPLSSNQYLKNAVWELLNEEIIRHFNNYWVINYELLSNVDDLTLNQCCREFANSYLIDPKNINNISAYIYFLMGKGKFNDSFYGNNLKTFIRLLDKELENKELNEFEQMILKGNKRSQITIDDVDLMSSNEFETFVASLFQKMGYSTTVTKQSGDQGIDVIAEKNGKKIGVQVKNYSGPVSNSAVQEVAAGIKHYGCDKGLVVTNSVFTNSAIELAASNEVALYDRNKLEELINRYFIGDK